MASLALCLPPPSPSSYRDITRSPRCLMGDPELNCTCRDPVSKQGLSHRFWGLRRGHIFWRPPFPWGSHGASSGLPSTHMPAGSFHPGPTRQHTGSPGRWVLPAARPQCGVQFVQQDGGGVGRGAFRSWNRPQSVLSFSVPRDAPSPSCSPCGSVTKCHRAGLLPPP